MYICKECGEIFDEPVITRDDPSPDGVSLSAGYYEYESCPYCDSTNIDYAVQCASCGEYMDDSKGSEILCDSCLEDVTMTIEHIMREHNLSEDDFGQVVNEIFGW